ncbi:MAG: hypothetical protein Q8P50_12275 [Bacillota bacterium]|nr:hypothetical protein [Bacillota bacterium]
MRVRRLPSMCPVVVLGLVLACASAAAAENDQVMKIGKRGQVNFDAEVKVGEVTLKPGQYTVQCRRDGSDHVMRFTPARARGSAAETTEVKCGKEMLPRKVSAGSVHSHKDGDVVRLTRIEIAGENVAHVF